VELTLPHNWAPRPKQQKLWDFLLDGGKRASVCWHRRFGKDDVALQFACIAAHERVGSYWHMLPEKEQARVAIWTAVNPHTGLKRIDEAFPLVLRKRTNDQEMFIEFHNGSTWKVVGSDNYNSLVGSSPCGIVFSEYALADPNAWAYFRPILRENKGWAIFISTPRGRNHFFSLHDLAAHEPGWFHETLTVEDTQLFSQDELEADLRELQAEHGDSYGRSIWEQENYCSFDAAIPGSFWAESLDKMQRRGGIEDFPIDPRRPVFTGWDLGRTDDTAIWFYQLNSDQLDVFDYFAAPGHEINDADDPSHSLVHVLLARLKQHGITYATHWIPHDARPRRQGMDGKSILQQFEDAAKTYKELGRFAIVPRLDVQEGVQAARKTFQDCRFHKTNCELGLQALRHYHREWDAELKKFNDNPVHDWSSHGADAWRYVSLSWKASKRQEVESPLGDQLHKGNPVTQSWGSIVKRHLDKARHARTWGLAR
jgi:phage terminase large subunit